MSFEKRTIALKLAAEVSGPPEGVVNRAKAYLEFLAEDVPAAMQRRHQLNCVHPAMVIVEVNDPVEGKSGFGECTRCHKALSADEVSRIPTQI